MDLNVASAKEILAAQISDEHGVAAAALAAPLSHGASQLSNGHDPSTAPAPTAQGYAERMQLINEEQSYNQDFNKYLSMWRLEDVGFGYDLCAVLGSQSTGKSTLLNKLFGTSFDVMDESQRRQTTKGIWMCRGNDCNVLVMDVEGTDGRERGEDQDFERKSALFSMASAEVLMVNMWEHQVGLYQGANMGLLKTVFEVNLSLFQASKRRSGGPKDKTLLLFIIRDHIGVTPLANLQATVLADLSRIWESLSKPEGLETSEITDFFDFSFTTLPHKVLQPAEFDSQVATLRQRFVDPKNPAFVFKTEYHKRIPADGLPHYLESIWDQVMSNKDLDLPTQQELLAQFRCDEIASAAFGEFAALIKPFKRPLEAGSVLDSLGADMGSYRGAALATFDKAASRYHQEVYKRKRLELLEKLNSALSPLFLGQLKNLHKRIVASFKAGVQEGVRGDGYDFGQVVSSEQASARTAFEEAATLILLADTDWSIEEEKLQLDEELGSIADQCRVEETKKMLSAIERAIKKEVAEPTELALGRPAPDMWDKILATFNDSLERAEATYIRKAKSFNSTEAEQSESLRLLRRRAWLTLHAKIEEQIADAVLGPKLRAVFEDRFRYDDEGVPRVWRPEDDIDGAFRKARDETLALIPLYARVEPTDPNLAVSLPSTSDDPTEASQVSRGELEEFDFPSTLVLFSETRRAAVGAALRRAADAYYVEAKRSTVSSVASIPYWMYAVLAALGWNEFLAVVRSPVYFTFLLLCAGAAYVVWRLNLAGPVAQVAQAVGREVHRLADQQLRAHFSQPLPQPAILREDKGRKDLSEASAGGAEGGGDEYELRERKKAE